MIQLDRKQKKRELDFYMLCKTFQENNINTEEKALESKENLKRNAVVQGGIVFIASILIAFFFPKTIWAVLMFAVILLLYICSFTYRGRNYLQRYIDEIIKHPNFDPEICGFPDVPMEDENQAGETEETKEKTS